MKKLYYLIILIVILGLVLTGCSLLSNISQVPTTGQSGMSYLTKGGPTAYPLYAGQDILVGEVIVSDDGENLCIQYQLSEDAITGGWLIYETHLDVANSFEGLHTNKSGNPQPGQFPYGDDEPDGVESWPEIEPFCISLADISAECDQLLYIAAHAVVKRLVPDCWEEVWQIGDVETLGCAEGTQLTNYADEFNWESPADPCTPGPSLVDSMPVYANPFIVGTNLDSEFPYNSNASTNYTYATDFDVQWNGSLPFGGLLTVSWSPGQSYDEIKEVRIDGVLVDTLNATGTPSPGQGWFMDKYPLVKHSVAVSPLLSGDHIINLLHTKGDGTFWDWIRLEKPCVQDETAWGFGDRFVDQGNWATFFTYVSECECVEQFWQIGTPDGAVDPKDGSAEYPANRQYYNEFTYIVGVDSDPIGAPSMPGYIGSKNVCDINERPLCTDTTKELNIEFELYCSHEEGKLVLIYDRYGSETDTLYFDFDGTPFATVVATEGGFKQFNLPLPIAAAGIHTITIAYEGGGDANGHYIDYLKLVNN